MKCQNCLKNEANFIYKQNINGVKKEIILCDECREKMGVNKMDFNIPISFSSFFGDMLNEYNSSNILTFMPEVKEIKCENCNTTYDEFMKTGKFGCANCYNVFENKIDPILKRIHGENTYLGRKSKENEITILKKTKTTKAKATTKVDKLEELKQELKKLIQEENYEQAAIVRDEIKKMEK
ncbi:MAG: UvrB/UvrC motif-containing protein [Lachnospiraceae bacterium]|jgi:protein arginine kinase activator|nr:UvrB/UvrC motif-containing protein [Lachnospiraceae bacterium]